MAVYQHGDVLLVSCPLPTGARAVGHRILARGEVTGHAHVLVEGTDATLYEHQGVLYLRVGAWLASVTHEEHGTRVVDEPGEYLVRRVREYDHFAEEAHAVQD